MVFKGLVAMILGALRLFMTWDIVMEERVGKTETCLGLLGCCLGDLNLAQAAACLKKLEVVLC